jgi:hypothetical protein
MGRLSAQSGSNGSYNANPFCIALAELAATVYLLALCPHRLLSSEPLRGRRHRRHLASSCCARSRALHLVRTFRERNARAVSGKDRLTWPSRMRRYLASMQWMSNEPLQRAPLVAALVVKGLLDDMRRHAVVRRMSWTVQSETPERCGVEEPDRRHRWLLRARRERPHRRRAAEARDEVAPLWR